MGKPVEPARRPPTPERADPAELVSSAFEDAPIAIALTATDGRFVLVNRALCELCGRPATQLSAMTIQDITHPDDVLGAARAARRMLTGQEREHEAERRYLRPDGRIAWGHSRTALIRDKAGDPLHFVSHILDVTEHKHAGAEVFSAGPRLDTLAVRDPLTGLRNHRDFRDALEGEIERAGRYERRLSLAIFDIDDFSLINTERGRAHGDGVLRAVATVIEEVSRRPDLAARIGGDEFGLILPETDDTGAARAAERVSERVAELYDLEVAVSFGIAARSGALSTGDEVLWAAERELQASKPAPSPGAGQLRLESL